MITLLIIIITSVISITAFNRTEIFYRLQLNPYQVFHRKQYYRIISHGFIHANWMHLIVNMFVLFFFGANVEAYFSQYFEFPILIYLLLYFSSMAIASATTIRKHKDNHWYNAVGASGAVSAIVFTSIFFNPWDKIYLYGIVGLPGILLGGLYLLYSYYMGQRSSDNINHDAHFYGAVFGFLFPIIIDYKLVSLFISRLMGM